MKKLKLYLETSVWSHYTLLHKKRAEQENEQYVLERNETVAG